MRDSKMLELMNTPIIDAHCHGFKVDSLLEHCAEAWQERITLMGMCFASSKSIDRGLAAEVSAMAKDSILAKLSLRWLANYLDCPIENLLQVRRTRLEENPSRYLKELLDDQHFAGLFVDDGYPLPRIDPAYLEDLTSVPIHRVVRIEPLIVQARESARNSEELEDSFRALLEEAVEDPRVIAFKTIIAYRTGLDVKEPSADEVSSAFLAWREADWEEGRETSKPVRDHLLNVTFEIARRDDRPVHIHSGAGDTDVVLAHARPSNLGPLLQRQSGQPILLIHSGYPWLEEATYLASVFPMVYLELSLLLPWSTLDIDRGLNLILGSVPTNKVLYGSDMATEPEILWISAKMARAALARVLNHGVERDYLSTDDAIEIGQSVLAKNALRLHSLEE